MNFSQGQEWVCLMLFLQEPADVCVLCFTGAILQVQTSRVPILPMRWLTRPNRWPSVSMPQAQTLKLVSCHLETFISSESQICRISRWVFSAPYYPCWGGGGSIGVEKSHTYCFRQIQPISVCLVRIFEHGAWMPSMCLHSVSNEKCFAKLKG